MAAKSHKPNNQIRTFFKLATDRCVVWRAVVMALVVGTILIAINHYHCIVEGQFGSICAIQASLTYLVPYSVSTLSSVWAMSCSHSD